MIKQFEKMMARGIARSVAAFSIFFAGISTLSGGVILDPTFDPGTGADGIVETVLPLSNGKILVCGNFTSFNGKPRSYVARLNANGSVDDSFEAHPGYWVRHMAVQPDGKIVIAGFFNSVAGVSRNLVARLNEDGSLDTSFDPGTGGTEKVVGGDPLAPCIFFVALQKDGKILVTGSLAKYNGTTVNGLARINPDGSLDATFKSGSGFDSWGRSIMVLPNDQILMMGWFTAYNGKGFNRTVRLNPDGTSDDSFHTNIGDKTAVYTAALLNDGKFLIGGHSLNSGGAFRQEFARLNPDGTFDTSFNPYADEKVQSLKLQPDGKIVIGGDFNHVNGVVRKKIARLNPDGSLDEGFEVDVNNFVWTVVAVSNDTILMSGGFSQVNGIARGGVARLKMEGSGGNTGSDPSAPQLSNPVYAHGIFELTATAEPGRQYTLEYRSENGAEWLALPAASANGNSITLSDPGASDSLSRIYRVSVK